jgi:hypothetical protein
MKTTQIHYECWGIENAAVVLGSRKKHVSIENMGKVITPLLI